jgi:integrase/recombinase XerD
MDKIRFAQKTDKLGVTPYNLKVIETSINQFLKSATLSIRTQELYRHVLIQFVDWCYKQGKDITKIDLLDATAWLDTHERWTPSTRHTAATVLKQFYKFKFGEDHPLTKLYVKRSDPGPQRTLTEEELTKLLTVIDTTSEKGVRDMAIVTLMVDTGLRSNEVCNILMRRMDVRNRRLTVLCKGGSWGEAIYFEYTAHCIDNWLAIRPLVALPDNEYLFCSLHGRTPGEPITRYGIRMLINKYAKLANLGTVNPHAMRRTFATLATEHGAPTRLVQIAGRWKSIRMVETYTRRVNPARIEPFSPVNHVMGYETEVEE